ncbi:MAG: hypothetical protein AAGA88_09020 [Pseudomonadota bacterium]
MTKTISKVVVVLMLGGALAACQTTARERDVLGGAAIGAGAGAIVGGAATGSVRGAAVGAAAGGAAGAVIAGATR